MLDVINGSERARSWPKPRGRSLHPVTKEQNEWFRQAQWATKFMAPEMVFDAIQATKGSPLLPRDILTMMMAGRLLAIDRPNGHTLWSAAVMTDVSTALDVLSDQPGSILIRGETHWTALLPGAEGLAIVSGGPDAIPGWGVPGGSSGGGNGGAYLDEIICSGGETEVVFSGINQSYRDLIISASQVRLAGATAEEVRMQINGDTSTSYAVRRVNIYGNNLSNAGYAWIATPPNSSRAAGYRGQFDLTIGRYSESGIGYKTGQGQSMASQDISSNLTPQQIAVVWQKSDPVTSLRFYPPLGAFAAGTAFTLFAR